MNNKHFPGILFGLLCLIQLGVPAYMIYEQEIILHEGNAYKFRTAPIDPADPFRGRYVQLNFVLEQVEVQECRDWRDARELYLELEHDAQGFARYRALHREAPGNAADYLKVRLRYPPHGSGPGNLSLELPFDRFYMEESKAPRAEAAYRDIQRDTSRASYAIVMVKEGKGLIKDVMIGDVSINDIVAARNSPPQ